MEQRRPSKATGRLVAIAGFVAGFVLIGALVWSKREPTETIIPGADVTAEAAASGGLTISNPGEQFLADYNLLPGQNTSGTLDVQNTTSGPIEFQLFANTSTPQANQTLRLDLTQDGKPVSTGTIAGYKDGSQPMQLAANGSSKLRVTVSLPKNADDRYVGVVKTISVQLMPPREEVTVTP